MAVLGGILLVVAVAVAAFSLWAASLSTVPAASVDMFDNTVSITSTTMFLLGALSLLLLLLGIWLAFFATRRRYRSHREHRTLEKREKEQAAELEETRRRLGDEGTRGSTAQGPRVEERAGGAEYHQAEPTGRIEGTDPLVDPRRDGTL